jgi:hypothetical protein
MVVRLYFSKKLCGRYKIALTAQTDFKGKTCKGDFRSPTDGKETKKSFNRSGDRSWNQAPFLGSKEDNFHEKNMADFFQDN